MDVFEKVRRHNLQQYKVDRIGGGHQGSVYRISVDGCVAAVKDIASRHLLYRLLLGRYLLAREYRVYQSLQGLSGIPRLHKKIDADGFIVEYVDGIPLSRFAKDGPLPGEFFDRLAELVRRVHDRGVVHSDLKHKKNILVGSRGEPYLIDFGASWLESGRWHFLRRWLYRQFRQIDLNAISKIRYRFDAGNPGAVDRNNLAERTVMERCSSVYQFVYRLFSKKHRWRRRKEPLSKSGEGPGAC
jgi:serine/threonine protein kinase